MSGHDLKNLKRADLLDILEKIHEENEELKLQNQELLDEVENKRIWAKEIGSIAEASLQLNGVFHAAQEACDQYVENIKMILTQSKKKCTKMEKTAKQECDTMLQEAIKDCEAMREQTKQECTKMREDARRKYEEMISLATQRCDAIWKDLYEEIKEASGYDFDMKYLLNERFRLEGEDIL